jgi:hypothetical protein
MNHHGGGKGAMSKRLPPMHPGEVLREEFLLPLKPCAGALARKMDVPRARCRRSDRDALFATHRFG